MPLYLYQGLETQVVFELHHPMQEAPLKAHPETGEPLRRLYTSVHIPGQHGQAHIQKTLSKQNLAQKGFTQYEKIKKGHYQRTVGTQGPDQLRV